MPHVKSTRKLIVGMDRRRALKLLAAGGATLGLASIADRFVRTASAATDVHPRFYLQIIPIGGMDAVYTADPKTLKEVDKGIDVPYAANAIVDSGGLRLGPSFRALAKWSSRLAIVNTFRQNSANHQSGLAHITRCKSHTTTTMPTLFDILGARRRDEAVGAVSLGAEFASGSSPLYLGEPGRYFYGDAAGVFEHLDRADPDDLRTAARVLKAQAEALGRHRLSAAEKSTADNLLASATLFERAAGAPRFQHVVWEHPFQLRFPSDVDFQRAVWLMENRLARCITVCVGKMHFDTHVINAEQADISAYLAFLLDKLFVELDDHQVDGRPLAEQTVVVIGSEIGRFPRLNVAAGKDHFPQSPFLLYGAPFKTGAMYGATDREMISLPVSLTTGRPDSGGHLLQIDDLGTSLLALDGADPEAYGYSGSRLRFLEA